MDNFDREISLGAQDCLRSKNIEFDILMEKQKLLEIMSDEIEREGPSADWFNKWNNCVHKRNDLLRDKIQQENNRQLEKNLIDLCSRLESIGTFPSDLIPSALREDLGSLYLKLKDHLGPKAVSESVPLRKDLPVEISKPEIDLVSKIPIPNLLTDEQKIKRNAMTGTMLGRQCVRKESYAEVFHGISKETPRRHSVKYSKIPRCESLKKIRKSWPDSESKSAHMPPRSARKSLAKQTPKRTKVRKSLMDPRGLRRSPSDYQIKKHSCVFTSPPRGVFAFNLHRNFKATQNLYNTSTRSSSPDSVKSDDSNLSKDGSLCLSVD